MRDGRPNTQVVQHRSTTTVIVSSQRSSPLQPFSLSTQNELYGYECRMDRGLRSTEIRTLQPTRDKNTQERPADAKPPFIYIERFSGSWRPHSLESELLDDKEIEVVGLVEALGDHEVEVDGGRRAAGAWRDAWRTRARSARSSDLEIRTIRAHEIDQRQRTFERARVKPFRKHVSLVG